MSDFQSTAHSGLRRMFPETLSPEIAADLQVAEWQWRALAGDTDLSFWGLPLCDEYDKGPDGHDVSFWHLVTQDVTVRRLDPNRIPLMGRVWALLEMLAEGDPRARWWREPWKKGWRLLVTPDTFKMVVVLRPMIGQRRGFAVVTAYPTGGDKKELLRERYEASWASGETFADCFALEGRRLRRYAESDALRLPAAGVKGCLRRELAEVWE